MESYFDFYSNKISGSLPTQFGRLSQVGAKKLASLTSDYMISVSKQATSLAAKPIDSTMSNPSNPAACPAR